ncbi:TRAP transporter small permease [Halomonas binhaiensis]|uniref:TRAP transporter small permease protein n=1 Tax=Halomonas binhaiensis TaxID=2562282 RepID=A0A5C1NIX8_9GAMM|nr:TRAP transporter small permease [Halomonas binhaiensis]QEM82810.1 TRAP transporter small permease [Halomonas binhaiensis]
MKGPDARFERILATLALVIIGLISLVNVVVRYITGGSFAFTEEFSVFLLVLLTFAGASVALRSHRHIRIGLLERALPERGRRVLILFQGVCGVVVLGLITWFGGTMTWQEYQWQTLSPGLGLPQWWYLIWLPLMSALMLLRQCQVAFDRWRGRFTDDA